MRRRSSGSVISDQSTSFRLGLALFAGGEALCLFGEGHSESLLELRGAILPELSSEVGSSKLAIAAVLFLEEDVCVSVLLAGDGLLNCVAASTIASEIRGQNLGVDSSKGTGDALCIRIFGGYMWVGCAQAMDDM